MGAAITDTEPVGGGSKGVGTFLQIGGAGGVAVWGEDVGAHPSDGAGPGWLPAQGRVTSRREAAEETGGW